MPAGDGWFWVCDIEHEGFEDLWNLWRAHNVATIGWPPGSPHASRRTFTMAMNRIQGLQKSARIAAFLKSGRIGGLGTFTGVLRIRDDEYDPLLPDDYEHGRRVGVKWDSIPDSGYYVSVPEWLPTPPRGTTLYRISAERMSELEDLVRDQTQWDHLADSRHLVGDEKSELHPRLLAQLSDLEPGMTLFDPRVELEYPAHPIRRIDILAKDQEGVPVIIEAKRHSVDDAVVGQTLRYMSWVRRNLGHNKPRGIIVAGEFTPLTRYAADMVPGLSLVRYTLINKRLSFDWVSRG